jgi:hypothetical protein
VLGWVVEEAQQLLGVIGDLGHGLGPLDAVVARERLDGTLGQVAVGRIPDVGQGLARAGLHGLGQAAQHVGDLVDPVTLLAGGRQDVAERRPAPQRPVADRHHRRPHAAAAQLPQQLGPAVGRLALAVRHGDQLLGAIGAHAHDHQAAPAGLLHPTRKCTRRPTRPRRMRSARSRWLNASASACQAATSRVTTAADSPPPSQRTPPAPGPSPRSTAHAGPAGQHLGHLRALAAPPRQDHRTKADPLAGHQVSPRSSTRGARTATAQPPS